MCFFKCPMVDATKLCPGSLGVAFGVIKGLWLLGLAWVGWLSGYGMAMINHIHEFYPHYDATLKGGLIGGVGGLVCGFIMGFIFGCIYNACVNCCCKKVVTVKKVKKM